MDKTVKGSILNSCKFSTDSSIICPRLPIQLLEIGSKSDWTQKVGFFLKNLYTCSEKGSHYDPRVPGNGAKGKRK